MFNQNLFFIFANGIKTGLFTSSWKLTVINKTVTVINKLAASLGDIQRQT